MGIQLLLKHGKGFKLVENTYRDPNAPRNNDHSSDNI
jgi:hypothetical protein